MLWLWPSSAAFPREPVERGSEIIRKQNETNHFPVPNHLFAYCFAELNTSKVCRILGV